MEMTEASHAAPAAAAAKAGKYLTFGLGKEVYGLEILKVQEIIGKIGTTRVPGSPSHIRGVINLRGKENAKQASQVVKSFSHGDQNEQRILAAAGRGRLEEVIPLSDEEIKEF